MNIKTTTLGISLALMASPVMAGEYEINTFLTVGAASLRAEAPNDDALYLQRIGDAISVEYDTRYGINLRTELTSNISGAAQLLAHNRDGMQYDMDLEWGFVEYEVGNLRLRVGKLNLQTFLLSDYIEVGYLYPWVRPPEEVYGFNPMRNYPGFEIMHTVNIGKGSKFTSMFFMGSNDVHLSPSTTFKARNGFGTNFQLDMPNFTLRAGVITPTVEFEQRPHVMPTPMGNLNMPGGYIKDNDRMYMTTFGFSFDVANFVGYGEYISVETDGDTHQVFPDQTGGYVTLGFQLGNVLPFVTVASAEAEPFRGTITDAIGLMVNPAVTQDSVSLGFRYDVNDYSAIKFEYKRIEPDVAAVQVDWSGFTPLPANAAMPFNAGWLMGGDPTIDDYDVVTLTYDMIF
ncbi:MAG: hypothetical protein OEZ38_04595 [Gammaproteobacteria bacterium]|nr:hypothetical protein [Gammaproteobacteria bacterium]